MHTNLKYDNMLVSVSVIVYTHCNKNRTNERSDFPANCPGRLPLIAVKYIHTRLVISGYTGEYTEPVSSAVLLETLRG